jgi:hypothetical protein
MEEEVRYSPSHIVRALAGERKQKFNKLFLPVRRKKSPFLAAGTGVKVRMAGLLD